MPITVVVRSSHADPARREDALSLTFDGQRIVIGRSDGSDVRLPDPSVSLRHASLRAQGAEYALIDEGSTNGTWASGVRLVPHTTRLVRSGDVIRVGRVWLELVIGQRPPTADRGLATRDLALALVRDAMNATGTDTCIRVTVAEGPDLGAVLRLVDDERDYVIGRAERCDLPLADEDASREHAVVVRRGGRVRLRDLASHNGVFLGETRIEPERDAVWRTPTMARIGVSVLALDEPVSRMLAELEAAPDEPLPAAEAEVPPPAPAAPPAIAPPAPAPPPVPAAPIVDPRLAPTVPRARKRRTWTTVDLAVVSIAILVIGMSLAGLVWVLR